MSTPQFQFKSKLDFLKKDVLHVLKSFPDGIEVSNFWSHMNTQTGTIISRKKYGLSKMSDVFNQWPNDVVTFEKHGIKFVKIRQDAGIPSTSTSRSGNNSESSAEQKQSVIDLSDSTNQQTASPSGSDKGKVSEDTSNESYKFHTQPVYANLLPYAKPIIAWVKNNLKNSKENCTFAKLQQHFRDMVFSKYKINCTKTKARTFLQKECADFLDLSANYVQLKDPEKAADIPSSSTPGKPSAMSLMSSMSAWGKPANVTHANVKKTEAKNATFKKEAVNSSVDVIDLTDDVEGNAETPTKQMVSPVQPTTSKFGSFNVPEIILKPENKKKAPETTPEILDNSMEVALPSKPIFPPSFNHVIDLTVKAVVRNEFPTKIIDVRHVHIPYGVYPPREQINEIAKECIEILADAYEHVTQERVDKLLCQRYNCHHLRQLGVPYVDQLPCVNELGRLLCKVNAYILSFVKTRAICTLHELELALREYASNNGDFSSLRLGPLQRFPLVYQHFRFPPDQADIPEITSMDVLDHFHNYLTRERLWQKRLELEPFMNYLVSVYEAEDAFMLGVKLRSLPLLASVMKKSQRDAGNRVNDIFDHCCDTMKNDMESAFRKFRANMLQMDEDGETVRQHYLKTRPEVTIYEIMEKFNVLLMLTQGHHPKYRTRKRKTLETFLRLMKDDPVAGTMLHLAICMSSNQLEETAAEILAPKVEDSDDDDDDDDGENSKKEQCVKSNRLKPPPIKDDLVDSLKKYIERCLNAGSLSLTHLSRMEEKLLEDYDFTSFDLMGYGRFLEFLISEAKQLLEESGGLLLGNSGGESDVLLKPHQEEIVDFIKQCQMCGMTKCEDIEKSLCIQYNVKEVRHLGHGNMSRLLHSTERRSNYTNNDITVFYQSSLIHSKRSTSQTQSKVGMLGHQSKDIAKICLHNCPLLEDMAEWSQWNLVFEPELGKLKDFIQKYGGVTNKTLDGGKLATLDFLAIELQPGKLVKIVSTTSPEHVVKALQSHDAKSVSGHLASMAISYKGVENMPLALLTSHIKTALLQMHADEDGISHQTAAQFVLKCLLCLPTNICVSLANQVFLDPLGQVIGSSNSKKILAGLCVTLQDKNHVEKLGCLLGIQEWTSMIQQKCQLSESSIQILPSEFEEVLGKDYQEDDGDDDDNNGDYNDDNDDDGYVVIDDVDEILDGDDTMNDKTKNDDDDVIVLADEKNDENESDEVLTAVKIEDVAMLEEVERTCEVIVNEIRRDEFGVGLQLSEDGQRLMKIQQERLGRSLDRLSKDLYSKDTHFVLELIQNADDNSYHDDLLSNQTDDCPAVKFIMEDDGICVLNNELGFSEKDIKAVCDVGRSTKGKHKFGYIGQKGIGFKSVFRVTDAPEVHSNGYHIKFDVNSGPMGYILPHWIEEEQWPSETDWMTCINLTFKPTMMCQTRTLAARFNDIHPSLLLFLHRLRQITVENKIDNTIEVMRRHDVSDNIIEIHHTSGCDRWLVVKHILDATTISLQAKSGIDVESTEIALGFPIIPKEQRNGQSQYLPPKQPVFAFLPLRSYGFRFIIQGDFDVPSSREDVDRDSSWNQWLRNEIHSVFIDALDTFKLHPGYSTIEAVCTYLQFVPLEDEVLDFFKPVASAIMKKLKAKPCMPTQPNSQGVISWKIPSQTVRVRDPLIRNVITEDLLKLHLNLFYLHGDVAAILNSALTSDLGVETLTSDHLFQLGKALVSKIGTDNVSESDVIQLAKWLACIYRSLDEFHHDDSVLTSLKTQRVLPLSDGQLVALADSTVFYPVPDSNTTRKQGKDPLYYLQQDVRSLHPKLLKTDDVEVNIQVHKLLLRLGIKQLSPFDIIHHHIIPVFKSQHWKSKSEGTLISYIAYIKDQTDKNNAICNLDEIKHIAVILTNHGFKQPSTDPVHFPHQYGNSIKLTETFSGYDWTILDTAYLTGSCTTSVIHGWYEFFKKIGVEEFLPVRKRDVCLKKEDWSSSIWKEKCSDWPQDETEVIIQDYYCKELDGLLLHNKFPKGSAYMEQMKNLCKYIDKYWEKEYSNFCQATIVTKKQKRLMETDSSFSIMLKSTPWLPAKRMSHFIQVDESVQRVEEIILEVPSNLYLKSPSVHNLLDDHVTYLDCPHPASRLLKFLDFKTSVSVESMNEFLLSWSERSKPNSPTKFCTTLQHMKNVYLYLGKEMKRHEFQTLLREKPVIFVPDKNMHLFKQDDFVSGKMLNRKEIWIYEKTKLFNKHRNVLEEFHSELVLKRPIETYYSDKPEMIQLFIQEGKFDVQPKVEEYIELLSLLCSTKSPKDKATLYDVKHIFTLIGQAIKTPSENMPDEQTANMAMETLKSTVVKKLQKLKVFPSKREEWVSLEDRPMIVDNRDWEKMFNEKTNVHYLDFNEIELKLIGNKKTTTSTGGLVQPEIIHELLKECNVKTISEVVDIRPTPSMIEPCVYIHRYFYNIIPVIQQYIKARYDEIYAQLEHMNTKKMLADAKFYQTGNLEVCYWLTNQKEDTFKVRLEDCVIDAPTFYFHVDHIYDVAIINREIAKYFSQGDKSCNSSLRLLLAELASIVDGDSYDTIDKLLYRHEAQHCVINDDEKWMVETPPLPEPEPEPQPEPEPEPVQEQDYGNQQVYAGNDQQTQSTANQDEEPKLRSWPPMQSMNQDPNRERKFVDRPKSNVWPPPKNREYFNTVSNLPSNIRMVQDENKMLADDNEENGGKTTNVSVISGSGGSQIGSHSGYSGTISGQAGTSEYPQTEKRKLVEVDLVDENGQEVKRSNIPSGDTEVKRSNIPSGDTEVKRSNIPSGDTEVKRSNIPSGDTEVNETGDGSMSYDESEGYKYNNVVPGNTPNSTRNLENLVSLTTPDFKAMVTDLTYDDLGTGADIGSVNVSMFNRADENNIGQIGEKIVAQYFEKQKSDGKILSYKWLNEGAETGSPYDFEVTVPEENGVHKEYIEVKSTASDGKDVFPISLQQIQFSMDKRSNFHVYRVYNACDPENVKLKRMIDLYSKLNNKQVRLCMLI